VVGEVCWYMVFLFCGTYFKIKWNIGLCISVYVLFIRSFCVLMLSIWKRSHMFNRGPLSQCEICQLFLPSCRMCVASIEVSWLQIISYRVCGLKDVHMTIFFNNLVIILVISVYVKVTRFFFLFFGEVFISTWFNLCFLLCTCIW
jgi:hypothetical protein